MATAPRLRMDRSRDFSTVHGERAPDDRHALVFFFQDGLAFDAHGLYVDGLLDDKSDPDGKLRALVERRLKKQGKTPAVEADAVADDDDNDTGGDAEKADAAGDINIEAWLRGEVQYQFFALKAEIRKRYHQNFSSAAAIVQHLVEEERVVPESELSPANRALLNSLNKAA